MLNALNACFSAANSCSACCGLFNLKMDDADRRAWLLSNTQTFLALDISQAESIVSYRKKREQQTMPQRVREDIYVCPFIGLISGEKTGCLLHPRGSPHPQIGLWPHPQNFSFYGEGICLAYDCLAKERKAYVPEFFFWAETATVFDYGRLASDHTLHRTLAALDRRNLNLSAFYAALASYYREYNAVTTSFEDVEKALPGTFAELCRYLASRINPESASAIAESLMQAAAAEA